ncbi:hypothetical protein HOY82DRAFT_591363 [Tuber indicum]|nr:hypothetical protein HOY82DRAFT_591363 [Tuber indicum]
MFHGIHQDFLSTYEWGFEMGTIGLVRRVFEAASKKRQSTDIRSLRNYCVYTKTLPLFETNSPEAIPVLTKQPLQHIQRRKPQKQPQLVPSLQKPRIESSRARPHNGKYEKMAEIRVGEITPSPTKPRHKTHGRARKHTWKKEELTLQQPRSNRILLSQNDDIKPPELPTPIPTLPIPPTQPLLPSRTPPETPIPRPRTCTTCTHTPCKTCKPPQMRRCCVCHLISPREEQICAKCYHLGGECVYCEEDFHIFVGCCRCTGGGGTGGGEYSFGREVCWESDVFGV